MPKLAERYSRALVTGAGSGLGKAFTDALIHEGIVVWGTSRRPEKLVHTGSFTPVKLDLIEEPNLREWYERWDSESGGFDLVVNNAGYSTLGHSEKMTTSEIENQMRVLLLGPIQIANVAVAAMRRLKNGCLINVSSVAGEMNIPFMSVYNSSKAGLSAFSQSLMLESPTEPPWIIDFRPGDYRTAFNDNIEKRFIAGSNGERVWRQMNLLMGQAPPVGRAAEDLIAALRKFRHCTQYSGSFVQTSIASLASRLLPNALKRKILRHYYKTS